MVQFAKKDPYLNFTEIRKDSIFQISASYMRRLLVFIVLKSSHCRKKRLNSEHNREADDTGDAKY